MYVGYFFINSTTDSYLFWTQNPGEYILVMLFRTEKTVCLFTSSDS